MVTTAAYQYPREKIWYEDPSGFLTANNLIKFLPDKDLTFEEQMNAIVRLALYFSLVVLMVRGEPRVLFVVLAAMLFTFLIHSSDAKQKRTKQAVLEKMDLKKTRRGELCVKPTRENPFMNVTMEDIRNFPSRPAACDITQSATKRAVQTYFEEGLSRDMGDVFNKEASDRQYYTAPVTTIPNDQTGFANWLYKTGKTCKEGNGLACPGSGFRGS